jgi:signal transduction histidine kinase
MFLHFLTWLPNLDRAATAAASRLLVITLVATIAAFDLLSGPEVASATYYLLPIAIAAWSLGRRAGLAVAIGSALAWLYCDATTRTYSHVALSYLNTIVRFVFFVVFSVAVSALRQSRSRERSLRQFIVHDLRAPLANIQTGLETLELIGSEHLNTTEQDLALVARVSARRMATLVDGLLDTDQLRPAAWRCTARRPRLRNSSPARRTKSRCGRAPEHHVPDDLRRRMAVRADRALAVRVLVNLLSNAIKFSPAGGTISLHVKPVDDALIAFSISDQGPGIPREWIAHVFEKYAQVESPAGRRSRGSGLGLPFCRLAVEAHGGRIWIEPDVVTGTTVTFTLPAARQ